MKDPAPLDALTPNPASIAEVDPHDCGAPGPLNRRRAALTQTEHFSLAPWPDGHRWAYSITFDEALADLHRFAVPLLAEHEVPGHLEVVVSQIGRMREIGDSSYNGMRHMSAEELREMLDAGWGVGNHSWSHRIVNAQTCELELGHAKAVLEQTIGQRVTVYCAPGSNANLNDAAIDACRAFGYLGAMSITDALNWPNSEDLLWINRTFLHDHGYGPFFSAFDPYRNILYAQRDSGWLIDYLHCPLEQPIHPQKDCSANQLERRLAAIRAIGGDEVWCARVEDAVEYRYVLRHAHVESLGPASYRLSLRSLPTEVSSRRLTLLTESRDAVVEINGRPTRVSRRSGGVAWITLDLSEPLIVRFASETLNL